MQDLSYRKLLEVTSLPTPSAALNGVLLKLSTDDKPYYCDGVSWTDLTSQGGGSSSQKRPYLWG